MKDIEAEDLLRDCLESVDWSILKNSVAYLDEYATIVTDFISCLDPLQFSYNHKRPTADTISLALYSSLEHLDNKYTYVRLLPVHIDYSSAFNPIIQTKPISKPKDPDPQTVISENRKQHLLPDNPQHRHPTRLYTQPLTIFRVHYDCMAKFHPNSIYMFADDTTVQNNRMDFRKQGGRLTPTYINGAKVEMVERIKFLGVMIANNLSWSTHIDATVKKAQHLYFLRRLWKFHVLEQLVQESGKFWITKLQYHFQNAAKSVASAMKLQPERNPVILIWDPISAMLKTLNLYFCCYLAKVCDLERLRLSNRP
eukprot:g45896.t1